MYIIKILPFATVLTLASLTAMAKMQWQYDPVFGGVTGFQTPQQQQVTIIRNSIGRHPYSMSHCDNQLQYSFQESPASQRVVKIKQQFSDSYCAEVASFHTQHQVFGGLERIASFNNDGTISYTVNGAQITIAAEANPSIIYKTMDRLRSTRAILSNTGGSSAVEALYGYDSLGQVTIADGHCAQASNCEFAYTFPDLFQGHQFLSWFNDATAGEQRGLVDNNDRFYSQDWGLRFDHTDSARASISPYTAYADNPANYIDLDGRIIYFYGDLHNEGTVIYNFENEVYNIWINKKDANVQLFLELQGGPNAKEHAEWIKNTYGDLKFLGDLLIYNEMARGLGEYSDLETMDRYSKINEKWSRDEGRIFQKIHDKVIFSAKEILLSYLKDSGINVKMTELHRNEYYDYISSYADNLIRRYSFRLKYQDHIVYFDPKTQMELLINKTLMNSKYDNKSDKNIAFVLEGDAHVRGLSPKEIKQEKDTADNARIWGNPSNFKPGHWEARGVNSKTLQYENVKLSDMLYPINKKQSMNNTNNISKKVNSKNSAMKTSTE